VPRCEISEAAAVWFRAFTTDVAIKYYATNQSTSKNAEALVPIHVPNESEDRHSSKPATARTLLACAACQAKKTSATW
jgi:hypothetical protein